MSKGMDAVLPSDYDKLVVARQQELKYIDEELERMIRIRGYHDATGWYSASTLLREAAFELRQWLNSRRTCYAVAGATPQ